VTVTLVPSDGLSGVAETWYRGNGGALQSGTSIVLQTEGVHTLTFWSVDELAMADVEASRRAATLLAHRLKLLGGPALAILQPAAVLGKELDPDLLADLLGRSHTDLLEFLGEARRRHLVWSHDGRWAFVHDKIRQAVLEAIPPDERRRLHLAAARHLEEHHRERTFEIAYHFDAAGQSERASPYALVAAEQARAQHALDVAQQQYEIAERGTGAGDVETSRRITEGLGDVLMLRGSYEEAEARLEAARGLCPDRICEAKLAVKLGDLAFKRGDLGRAREELERGIRVLGRFSPKRSLSFLLAALFEVAVQVAHTLMPRLFCGRRSPEGAEAEFIAIRLYSRLAHVYWFAEGTPPTLWAHLREMNLAERYPPSPELAQAYSEHAPAASLIPYYRRGARYGQRSLEIRRTLGDLWGQGQSLSFLGILAYASSRFDECFDHCQVAARLLARTGDRWEQSTALQHVALALYRMGDLRGAVDVAEQEYRGGYDIRDAQSRSVGLPPV
jgi:tetratricopeptide (TPR) repeat protein